VQLLPPDLKPVLEVTAHGIVGSKRNMQMLREGVRKKDDIGRWGEQNGAIDAEPVTHREGYRGATEGVANQRVRRSDHIRDGPERTGELGQGSLVALGRAMCRRIEQDNFEAVIRQCPRQAAEPARSAAPSVGENHHRSAAPGPHRQILVLTLDDLRCSSRKERLFGRTRLIARRPAEDGLGPPRGDARRNRSYRSKGGAKHPERRRGPHHLSM
jgi:hypothetical protein